MQKCDMLFIETVAFKVGAVKNCLTYLVFATILANCY